jgi:transposase
VLSKGQKMAVEWFCCDMHDPFIEGAKTHLPNAKICVDRFHVVQLANKAFDQVRKEEIARAESQFQKDMLLPSKRFILVSREKDLSKAELKQLDRLREENKNINTAMVLVEYIHKAFDKTTLKTFRETMGNWYRVVRESKLVPFLKFAKTIRQYRKLIENYILSRLTTAVSEGLNKLKH